MSLLNPLKAGVNYLAQAQPMLVLFIANGIIHPQSDVNNNWVSIQINIGDITMLCYVITSS